jgi:hypothetical protein
MSYREMRFKNRALVSFQTMNARVCRSMRELNAVFRGMTALLPEMVDELLRETLEIRWLDLAGAGNPPTPIDTGRARTGWVLDTRESEWVPPVMKDNPKTAEEILAAVRTALDRLPRSTVYYLYNNVPYILFLEHGHSRQAPNGFIALALQQMALDLQRRVTELNNDR